MTGTLWITCPPESQRVGNITDWETEAQRTTHKLQQAFLVIQSQGRVATVKRNWEGVLSVELS